MRQRGSANRWVTFDYYSRGLGTPSGVNYASRVWVLRHGWGDQFDRPKLEVFALKESIFKKKTSRNKDFLQTQGCRESCWICCKMQFPTLKKKTIDDLDDNLKWTKKEQLCKQRILDHIPWCTWRRFSILNSPSIGLLLSQSMSLPEAFGNWVFNF